MYSLSRLVLSALMLSYISATAMAADHSTCFGTTSSGRLEDGWKLPAKGENFKAYSTLAGMLGRTYVHSDVHAVVLDAYAALRTSMPDAVFVYGETGKKNGGEFKPHKTHQNGLSIDFMVPVRTSAGTSVPLPTSALNKWGYDLEFDAEGRLDDLTIDALAMAEHLYQLHVAALAKGIGIWRVIFDPELQHLLEASERWEYLQSNLEFSTKRSWVRHDEHYHVDFEVACESGA